MIERPGQTGPWSWNRGYCRGPRWVRVRGTTREGSMLRCRRHATRECIGCSNGRQSQLVGEAGPPCNARSKPDPLAAPFIPGLWSRAAGAETSLEPSRTLFQMVCILYLIDSHNGMNAMVRLGRVEDALLCLLLCIWDTFVGISHLAVRHMKRPSPVNYNIAAVFCPLEVPPSNMRDPLNVLTNSPW
ncbi:hypothetical protein LIA77_10328 [Sarocladium implicatum]|nr:hypothetical protein LIA77_10328 [Sarocladium implicatum]